MGAPQRLIRLDGLAQSVSCDRPIGVNPVWRRYAIAVATQPLAQTRLTRVTPHGAVMVNNGSPFLRGFVAVRIEGRTRSICEVPLILPDQLRSYPAAKADIPELAQVKHVFVKAAARVNNRAENSHQPTRRRERQMCGFRDARRTQAFLSCFGPIRQHFALPRHQMNAACHRAILKERFATWHDWTVTAAAQKVI